MYRDENETTYLSAFDVTANSSVWLHSGDTVGRAKIGTTSRMIGSESPPLGHRRETFLVDKATAGKISNKVHVQSTDRRGTYQIAVPQICPDDSPKTSPVDEGNPEGGLDSDGYQKERKVTANCYETDGEKPKETNGDLIVEREKIAKRARRKDNRKTFVLNKCRISKEMDSRRGTFVIRKSSDSEKFNAEDADASGLNDTKENSPWDEANSTKQKGGRFYSSFFLVRKFDSASTTVVDFDQVHTTPAQFDKDAEFGGTCLFTISMIKRLEFDGKESICA